MFVCGAGQLMKSLFRLFQVCLEVRKLVNCLKLTKAVNKSPLNTVEAFEQ